MFLRTSVGKQSAPHLLSVLRPRLWLIPRRRLSDMITLTVVRHGESTDNLKPWWAGWSDAPLSVHGMNQAKALGESLASTRIDAIYASDLLRALWTAQQIERNQREPRPRTTVTPMLREQNFGAAERKPFGKQPFIRESGRKFCFENGESLDDVKHRASDFIATYLEPLLRDARGGPASSKHIAVVAHGIFNAEFIGALLARRQGEGPLEWSYKGMTNTGWTRLEVGYIEEFSRAPTPRLITDPEEPVSPSSRPKDSFIHSQISSDLPPLSVRIVCSDVTKHLDGIHRQSGGIGRQGYDGNQKDLRAFFSGAKK